MRALLQQYRRLLWWAAIGIVAVFGVWFFFFRHTNAALQTLVVHRQTFSQTVSVSGTVVAAQNSDLGFAQSGRLSNTFVSVGDSVVRGQVIAEVENGDVRAALAQKQAALKSAEANLSSLQVGTRPEELAVSEAQVASDQTALAQAEQSVADAIQSAYTTSDDAVHNKIDQFFTNPKTSNPQLVVTSSDSNLQSKLLQERVSMEALLLGWQKDVAALDTTNLAAAQSEAQNNLAEVSALLSDSNAVLNSAVVAGSVTSATLSGYITTAATARTNVNSASTALTSAISAARAAAALLDKDQKSLALARAGSTPQTLEQAQAAVAAAQADVESAQAQLAKTEVVAPFDGIITRMDAKVGEIVSPGTSEIAMQSNGVFEIECYVPEVNIAQVAVGDAATTTLDAYGPDTTFGASVVRIDPAQTEQGGVSTYKTTLAFLARDARIKTGMTASVAIQTATMPNTIAAPSGAVYQKNGHSAVQLLVGSQVIERQVTTGAQSLGTIVITSGIDEGDVLVLNPNTSI